MVVSEVVVVVVLPVVDRMVVSAAHVRTDGRSSIVLRRVVRAVRTMSRTAILVLGSLADVELVLGAVTEAHRTELGRGWDWNGSTWN